LSAAREAEQGADDTRGQLAALVRADDVASPLPATRSRPLTGRSAGRVRARQDGDVDYALLTSARQPQRALVSSLHGDERVTFDEAVLRAKPGCGCGPSISSARSTSARRSDPSDRRALAADLVETSASVLEARRATDASPARAARGIASLDGACADRSTAWSSTATAAEGRPSERFARAALAATAVRARRQRLGTGPPV